MTYNAPSETHPFVSDGVLYVFSLQFPERNGLTYEFDLKISNKGGDSVTRELKVNGKKMEEPSGFTIVLQ
ncbi:hypothetical protein [Paramuribaculum intestinale]|uniref:hypothetical protein n=1 Tax=Paramuribaculum intestinale TaxID=2094151 RepID=UPI000F473062|nr:hypothetical protein [Paramuribaculum intestinale]ROT15229.1 hypothetical protein EEL50_05865 [Muribaculaceae bacterium Isolate-105 (HZI)]